MQTVDENLLTQALVALLREEGRHPIHDTQALTDKVREAIAQATPGSGQSETRRVTILLSDLRGYTATAERYSGLAMVEALNRYLEKMSEIILRNGGIIDKFMGDSIMALFGAPESMDNDIESALRCAIEMQCAMDEVNHVNAATGMAPLYMGIGINSGEVVLGQVGSHYHSEYTVIGDEVNLTSRVEAHSLRGQILLSEKVYTGARDYIEIGQINEVHVKGKKLQVRMYELKALTRPQRIEAPPGDIRKGPRVEVDMPLHFQVVLEKKVEPARISGRIVDISYGGMYIRSAIELPAFSDVKMMLSVSPLAHEQSEIYGKILRVNPFAEGFEYRIEFTSIDPQAQQALKGWVDDLVGMR
jgi:adenylate cyclase